MLHQSIVVLILASFAQSEANYKNHAAPSDTNRMMGVDTVRNVKIDKNTVITRNLKIGQRDMIGKTAHQKSVQEDRDPDWSYRSIPGEVAKYADDFKRNMSECLREVQGSDKRTVRRLSPGKYSPVHGDCLIACVLKRNHVILNGKVHKENLISLVSKFYAKNTRLIKKLTKNLDRCVDISARASDACELAAKLNECTNDLMASNKHKITLNY